MKGPLDVEPLLAQEPIRGLPPDTMMHVYLVGEFSVLLGDLEQGAPEWQVAVHRLRAQVEHPRLASLPALAEHAMELADTIAGTRSNGEV